VKSGSADISVVIPTHNRAELLLEALGSVFAQTQQPSEVIVVDDGSNDGTRERLASLLDRLRYVFQEHRGVAAARNRGIREAGGEWIAFLDSDDRWLPHALATLVEARSRYPEAGLIAMASRHARPDGTVYGRVRGKKSRGAYFTTLGLLNQDTGGVLTPMVRRSVLLDAGGFDESFVSAEDCDLWLRLSFVTPMVGIPDPLLLRRKHPGAMTRDRRSNARMWLRILDKLEHEHPDFVRGHRTAFRRSRGKEHLRLGREMLRHEGPRDGCRDSARRHLKRSIRAWPFFLRAYRYLLLSYFGSRAGRGATHGSETA
jgi:glycosyltransferase involved in cell wall biosynthesis